MKVLRVLGGVGLGVLAAALGTVAHRGHQPWGLVGALALVLATGVMARSWAGWGALAGHVLGLAVTLVVLSRTGPGGSVLMPAGEDIGWWWLGGAVAMVALVALAPRRMFVEPPAGGAVGAGPDDGSPLAAGDAVVPGAPDVPDRPGTP